MHKLVKPGRIVFAIGIAALGVLCFILKDFIVGRPPAWGDVDFPLNPVLGYVSGDILIIAAFLILFSKKAALAALLIAILILLLSVLRHIPHFMNDWLNAYKSMALFGGALIIAGSFFQEDDNGLGDTWISESVEKGFVTAGSILLAVFFIASGYHHFKSAEFVKKLIPAYIPFHAFFTYFCGICLFAGGVGLLIPQTARWAAFLLGIMITGWFIFLHIPRLFADTGSTSERLGLCESLAFAGICFVLAGMRSQKFNNSR